jgi:excisionase family DNA binding protein
MAVKEEKRTLTLDEWAHTVGVGRSTAHELARAGKLPGLIKLGGRYLVSRAVMDRMLEGTEKAPMA